MSRVESLLSVLPTLYALECSALRPPIDYALLIRESSDPLGLGYRLILPRPPFVNPPTVREPIAEVVVVKPLRPVRLVIGKAKKRPRHSVQWDINGYDTDEWNA